MKMVRLHADSDGESHFADDDVALSRRDFAPPASPIYVSGPTDTTRMLFFMMPPGWYGEPHPSPRRQFYIQLTGELEIVASDGVRRVFRSGDAVLLEDVGGKGHASRVLSEIEVTGVFVQLD